MVLLSSSCAVSVVRNQALDPQVDLWTSGKDLPSEPEDRAGEPASEPGPEPGPEIVAEPGRETPPERGPESVPEPARETPLEGPPDGPVLRPESGTESGDTAQASSPFSASTLARFSSTCLRIFSRVALSAMA